MSKKKRLICSLLAAAMLLPAAGCGQKQKTETQEDDVTLTWFVPGDKQPDHDIVMEEVNKLIEPKIGAKLDINFIDMGSFGERMRMNMAAQSEFDLMFVGYLNKYDDVVNNGGCLDITEMLDDVPALKASIPDYVWDAAKSNGKIYAVPNVQIMTASFGYNIKKDIVDKYNIDVSAIKNPSDIESVLSTIKENEPNMYPIQPKFGPMLWAYTDYQLLSSIFLAVRKDDPECKVVNLLDTPEYQEGITKLREWFLKGYIRPDIASVTDDNIDLNQGKYGVLLNGLKPGLEESFYQSRGYEVVTAQVTDTFYDGTGALSTMIGVSSTSKHPDKALKLIELMNTDKEIYNMICFGIEGKHYLKNDDGKVTYVENSGWAPKADWKFGNQFNAMLLEGQSDDVWEQTEKVNSEAAKSRLIGFEFVDDNVVNEISQIASINDEFYKRMSTGYDDPDTYLDQYKEKLKLAGIDKVQEELQKQVDEFLAKNK